MKRLYPLLPLTALAVTLHAPGLAALLFLGGSACAWYGFFEVGGE